MYYVYTYYASMGAHMKNINLSIDDALLQAGREYARQHNTSFNVLVRRLIEQTVVQRQARWLDDTFSLMDKADVKSGHEKWTRGDLYRVKDTHRYQPVCLFD